MKDPQVTMALDTEKVIHELDDLGVPSFGETSIWTNIDKHDRTGN